MKELSASEASGADLKRILEEYPPDPDWAEDIRWLRASLPVQERDWPD